MAKPILEFDGDRVHDLDSFWDEVSRALIPGAEWGRNLDAFNDILRGGFGTPEGGFVLRWVRADISRAALGYPQTVRYLERKVHTCHPSNISIVQADLAMARRSEGQTLFEILVEIIHDHGPGGDQQEDGVELELR